MIAGRSKSGNAFVHLAVLLLVIIWTAPTAGLLISSLRAKDLLSVSGWWTARTATEQSQVGRAAGPEAQVEENGRFFIRGNVFGSETVGTVNAFGVKIGDPRAFKAGETAELTS